MAPLSMQATDKLWGPRAMLSKPQSERAKPPGVGRVRGFVPGHENADENVHSNCNCWPEPGQFIITKKPPAALCGNRSMNFGGVSGSRPREITRDRLSTIRLSGAPGRYG
jgi:hypothetical protein